MGHGSGEHPVRKRPEDGLSVRDVGCHIGDYVKNPPVDVRVPILPGKKEGDGKSHNSNHKGVGKKSNGFYKWMLVGQSPAIVAHPLHQKDNYSGDKKGNVHQSLFRNRTQPKKRARACS